MKMRAEMTHQKTLRKYTKYGTLYAICLALFVTIQRTMFSTRHVR